MPDRPGSKKTSRVAGVMLPTDEYLHPDHPVSEAAGRMRAAHLSMLPVVDGDEIVGIYTLAHLAQRKDQPPVPAAAEDARASRVRDHMSADIPYCYEQDDIGTARQLLERHDLPWLLVVNRDDEYVGLISAESASEAGPAGAASPRPAARRARATGRARTTDETGTPGVYAVRPKLRR
ncbi:CBS domain-containing protein [Desertibaculum subflavum]|uniref:CBS domain-containing protein n=1 Tax=Desertibaculum subflavum TaxID=2268458 RepID=UPI000E662180